MSYIICVLLYITHDILYCFLFLRMAPSKHNQIQRADHGHFELRVSQSNRCISINSSNVGSKNTAGCRLATVGAELRTVDPVEGDPVLATVDCDPVLATVDCDPVLRTVD